MKNTSANFTFLVATCTLLSISTTSSTRCPVEERTNPAGKRHCTFQVPSVQETVTFYALGNQHSPATKQPRNPISVRQAITGAPFKLNVQSPPSQGHLQAVQHCVSLAASTWVSSVETRAKFYFSNTLGRADILGDARPGTTWYVDGYLYPVAMAKSLLVEDVNALHYGDERYDIIVRLNSKTNWYVGIDAQPGENQYDLVTVCLHEMYHGLMISGGNLKIDKHGSDGGYDGKFYSNIDRRFDAFLACETKAGDCAIASYRGVDRMLGRAVTGNSLWFRASNERIGRLYSPPVFKFGSSVYHLSEAEYGDATNDNSLMTPSMPVGYAQHNIGPVVVRMQALMLNESEFGAPLCNSSLPPLAKEEQIIPRSGNNSTQDGNTKTGGCITLGSVCFSVGTIVGIALGSIVGVVLVIVAFWLVCCFLPSKARVAAGR